MKEIFAKPLFVFEMANNHQGKLEHGLNIIRGIKEVCRNFDFNYAFKFQYRDLKTFIHPEPGKFSENKHLKRFQETRLERDEFLLLKKELDEAGFFSICTPFDEASVRLIEEHGFDVIKIASCSVGDWSLIERIAEARKPVIASTAGSSTVEIDRLVSFFLNRGQDLTVMHCVAEYPTIPAHLQLNQIDFLRSRYPGVKIGFSTHEEPDNLDAVKIAVAKGAAVYEKHVGIAVGDIKLNSYSANPEQVAKWLAAAQKAFIICGERNRRYEPTEKEIADLASLRRGVFARQSLARSEKISLENCYLAFPCIEGQMLANDLSKYHEFSLEGPEILSNQPVMLNEVRKADNRPVVEALVKQIINLVLKSQVIIPVNSKCDISHHYGLSKFSEYGAAIINCVNREYCKKIIILLPGQSHPSHLHKQKEETFTVLYGDLGVELNGVHQVLNPGESITIPRGGSHAFSSVNGAVFEEISTTHFVDDSFYEDARINANRCRKTEVYLTKDLLR